MLRFCFLVFSFFLSFIVCSCSSTEPVEQLNISLADASCTEAWLQVTGETGKEIRLLRDDKEVQRFTLTTSPMTVFDDSLQINTSYSYRAERTEDGEKSSIKVTTLDTTSHNFTWESFTFGGDIGSSSLNDVAIIDNNNIWAVGEIYVKDTSENGYTVYNAVHWDGHKWELKRIKYYGDCSFVEYPELRTIWTSENIIIISNGGSIGLFNGEDIILDCKINQLITGAINKIWGINRNDYYVVGNDGNIVHYQNGQWNKLESGTDLPVRDIWGDFNVKTNQYEILAVAAEVEINKGSKILRINGSTVREESNDGLSWDVGSIWFKPGSKYYVSGAGIHYKHLLNDSAWSRYQQGEVTNYVSDGIRGNNINDVFAVGSFLEIVHFNGLTWQNYRNEFSSQNGALGRIAVKGNTIVTAGFEGRRALLVVGKRNSMAVTVANRECAKQACCILSVKVRLG